MIGGPAPFSRTSALAHRPVPWLRILAASIALTFMLLVGDRVVDWIVTTPTSPVEVPVHAHPHPRTVRQGALPTDHTPSTEGSFT